MRGKAQRESLLSACDITRRSKVDGQIVEIVLDSWKETVEGRNILLLGILWRGGGCGGGALKGEADEMLGLSGRRVGDVMAVVSGGVGIEEYEVAAGWRLLLLGVRISNVGGIHENQRL